VSEQAADLKIIDVVAGVAADPHRVLMARRAAHKSLAGKWEFPGGKVERGEDPRAALQRELREELGVEATVGDEIGSEVHHYQDISIRLTGYFVQFDNYKIPTLKDHDMLGWKLPYHYDPEEMAPADLFLLERLAKILPRPSRKLNEFEWSK
jgi:8-oxo-dGTP diphosphatase